jgi:hypothetical protein
VGGLYPADSLLTSASLEGLSLPKCRLVVLAACMTGSAAQPDWNAQGQLLVECQG